MIVKFKLNIESGNAALTDGGYNQGELARCIETVAVAIECGHESGVVKDINGNTIGKFNLVIDEIDEN